MSEERLYGAFDGLIAVARWLFITGSVLAIVVSIVAVLKERMSLPAR